MSELIIAFVTTNTEREASSLAKKLINGRLAACVNIISNIRSFYEWEGDIHDDQEHLLIIKSVKENVEKLKEFVEQNHTYEVPEFIVISATDSLPDYLQWVKDATSPGA